MDIQYEIGIIGAGPAGYHAALEAARCKKSVVLIDKRTPGGVCLYEGCIPTKSLVANTKAYFHLLKNTSIEAKDPVFNWDNARLKKEKDVKKLSQGLMMQFKQREISILQGEAHILEATEEGVVIKVGEDKIGVSNVIVATGSENVVPPIEGLKENFDHNMILDSTDILEQCKELESLIVIGAGVIGLEIASIYANTNTKVTVLERETNFLPMLDDATKAEYLNSLKRKGVQVVLGQNIKKVEKASDIKVTVTDQNGMEQTYQSKALFVAAGRRSVYSAFTIEEAGELGIKFENNKILTDENGRTTNPRIFACGDMAGKSMLAYTAGMEGERAVRLIAGIETEKETDIIPGVVFSNPEAAFVGKTLNQCKENGIKAKTFSCSMNYSSLFAVENERENGCFCLVYEEESGKVLGCHMIGNGASEVIGTMQSYIAEEKTLYDIQRMPIMHPSRLEVIKEAINLIL